MHGVADGARCDAVARADQRLVGKSAARCLDAAFGHQIRSRVRPERAAHQRTQRPVGRGIADEDAAEQRLRIVGEDELLVDARDRVGVDHVERSGRGGERVAEAGDVDAGELELRREVVARERRLAAQQPRRRDLGHGVPGGDQPDALSFEVRDLADRQDVRVGRAAAGVDEDSAALVHTQAGLARELVPRTHPDGEHHDIGAVVAAVPELQADHPAGLVGIQAGRHAARSHADAAGLDQAPQGVPGRQVELRRHEPIGGLHDGGVHAEVLQGAGRFQSEQTAADHHAGERASEFARPGGHVGAQRLDVIEGAIDEASAVSEAVDLEAGGEGAGREHQVVVRDHEPARGHHTPFGLLQSRDRVAGEEGDPRVAVDDRAIQGELIGGRPAEEGGQPDAIVRCAPLLADQGHPPVGAGTRQQALDEAMRHHARADHDHMRGGRIGVEHAVTVARRCCVEVRLLFRGSDDLRSAGFVRGHGVSCRWAGWIRAPNVRAWCFRAEPDSITSSELLPHTRRTRLVRCRGRRRGTDL